MSLAVVGTAIVWYTGVYTYFQTTEVQESLPTPQAMPSASMKPGATAPAAAQPNVLLQGTFGKVDAIHQGSGTAKIIEVGGKRYLRFENFEVTNGPDLYVYLAQGTAPTNDTASLGKYFDLGRLKGNIGDQNYELPEGTGGFATAVIWCKKFGVLFSYAVMK